MGFRGEGLGTTGWLEMSKRRVRCASVALAVAVGEKS